MPRTFTPEDRDRIRAALLARARADDRITGAAVTGSTAAGTEDRWSDVDLAFGIRSGVAVADVLESWTERMYRDHAAVTHVDVLAGAWVYRVFLLLDTLQVDLAFAPQMDFGAVVPATFRLIHGEAATVPSRPQADPGFMLGMAWLFALHARSSLERGRLWQAEYWLSGVRDHVLALACHRLGLPSSEGRGFDRLPKEVTQPMAGALVVELSERELRRAFTVVLRRLHEEAVQLDPGLAGRLRPVLDELTRQ